MNSNEIRKVFLDYFREKGHEIKPPAGLIPQNDPSLLFTGAGMNQFKDLFFGKGSGGPSRAATCQRCFRATDIENVGRTSRHLTFLEMLGNFSFGDYFKEQAAEFAWEFLSGRLKIPKEKMLVTVFENDDETHRIWTDKMGVPENRIFRMGAEDNFWEMGRTGPCGPCSEILIDRGGESGCGKDSCGPSCGCDRHMELWNLVFTQFNRTESGGLEPLSQKNIDTGMGLERAACIVQSAGTVFETDLLKPLAEKAGELTGAGTSARRIIADHARSAVFLAADGVTPSNEGRGFVLRKLIRRMLEKNPRRNQEKSIFPELVNSVCSTMKDYYPYLEKQSEGIIHIMLDESDKFAGVFDKLPEVEEKIRQLKSEGKNTLPGEAYFMFYDTYGIPRETIREKAGKAGLAPDEEGFEKEMENQRRRSRKSSRFTSSGQEYTPAGGETIFTGYSENTTDSSVLYIIKDNIESSCAEEKEPCCIITRETPFYPESGGQKSDRGEIFGENWVFKVRDAFRKNNVILHFGQMQQGSAAPGDCCTLSIDADGRGKTSANHTATHLLQSALKETLGSHVRQAGSFVDDKGLRFDFNHTSALKLDEIKKVEDRVNSIIRENIAVRTSTMALGEALEAGAACLPGEKYDDSVRVVKSGKHSMELCGGTHAQATGDLGLFIILSESSISSGVRRIEALTGSAALERINLERELLKTAAAMLKTSPRELPSRIEALAGTNRELEKQISELKAKKTSGGADKILEKAAEFEGIQLIIHEEEGLSPENLGVLADEIRKKIHSGFCLLASTENNRVHLAAFATPDLVAKGINAGLIVKQTALCLGGGGGGRPDFAKAGGKDPDKLPEALKLVPKIIKKQIGSGK